jgi:hypothetical protein
MPFENSNNPEPYVPSPPPILGNDRGYLERELRNISVAIQQLQRATKEIQDYLKTLP